MGLGKTIIGIAAAEKLLEDKSIDCCIIVCPSSIKFQWADRIDEFTDGKCVVIDGPASKRKTAYREGKDADYLIVSYDCVVRDSGIISNILSDKKYMAILDEATAIKTFKAQRTKTIKRIFRTPYRLALTGTPIENRPDELFSIMQWVDDTVLGKYHLFDKAYINRNAFGWPTSYKNLPVLRKRIAPALARKSRFDPDVKPYLPDVDEDNWYVDSDPDVMDLYKLMANDMLSELANLSPFTEFNLDEYYRGSDESRTVGKLMAMYMCMEMLLDHPELVAISGMRYEMEDFADGSAYANHLWRSGVLSDLGISGKLEFLLEKIDQILLDEGKILIFSKYKKMVRLINMALTKKGIRSVMFHGDMNSAQKAAAVSIFTNSDDCRVLVSSHAGAYGMDMYMANYLINYDLPWSAGKYDQINSRHVRASSEFSKVYVRNLVTRGSIEERHLRILRRKSRVASAILDGKGGDEYGRVQLDGDTLKQHLISVLG